jgi:hypothetical protein
MVADCADAVPDTAKVVAAVVPNSVTPAGNEKVCPTIAAAVAAVAGATTLADATTTGSVPPQATSAAAADTAKTNFIDLIFIIQPLI